MATTRPSPPGSDAATTGPGDRRSARWDEHRRERRADLVAAAVRAVDEYGAAASIAQIAEVAGVSKPVLYRYFNDKDDLYRAVGEWGADVVLGVVLPIVRSSASPRAKVDKIATAYLKFIDEHQQVFFLLVEHRSADPLAGGKQRIATLIARVLGEYLRELGLDAGGAEPWAHGMVGLGLAHGEWWLRRRTMSRKVAAGYLADFIWHAVSGVARDNGLELQE